MKFFSVKIKRLVFYWLTSFLLAVALYYIIFYLFTNDIFMTWLFTGHYHKIHPVPYIAILCFFYGIFASLLSDRFAKSGNGKQILWTLLIIALAILAASPFGGILTYYYDMQAGYFPENWPCILLTKGALGGLQAGWFLCLTSVPYSIICAIGCYFLTKTGVILFKNE